MKIIDYSEKAVAVVGETKPIKEQLKKLGGRFNARLSCGAGWIFPMTKKSQLQSLLDGTPIEELSAPKPTSRNTDKELLEEYLNELRNAGETDYWVDYARKQVSSVFKLTDGGLVVFEKRKIKTSFCFGWSSCGQGQSYDEACKQECNFGERQFLNANLRDIDDAIERIEKGVNNYKCSLELCTYQRMKGDKPINVFEWVTLTHTDTIGKKSWYTNLQPCSEGDKQIILDGLRRERDKFEQRLRAYLKRYGTSKLRTWTYWIDE